MTGTRLAEIPSALATDIINPSHSATIWRWRLALPTIALGFLGIATGLYVWVQPIYLSILSALMLRPNVPPFFDFEYLLNNATCWQRGVNVYVSNPCDPMNRPMGYSPLWLRMDFLAIDPSWSAPFGLGLAVLFCLSLAFLVPSPRWRDQLVIGLAAVSSLSLYAIERGNIDVVVYLFAIAAGTALAGGAVVRTIGYGLLLAAGILKFYPVVALLVLVRERLKMACTLGMGCSLAILIFVLSYHTEIIVAVRNIPGGGYFWDTIGARQLPGGIGFVLQPILAQVPGVNWGPAVASSRILIYIVAVLIIASLCAFVVWIACSAASRQQVAALPPRYGALLQIGAALMVGCFFTGESVGYRAIMVLLVLPGLLLLARPETPRPLSRISRCTLVVVLVVLFRLAAIAVLESYSLNVGNSAIAALTWIVFELAWWWIIAVLSALLTCSILESEAIKEFWANFRRLAPQYELNSCLNQRSAKSSSLRGSSKHGLRDQ